MFHLLLRLARTLSARNHCAHRRAVLAVILCSFGAAQSQTLPESAPGAPGDDAQWTSAAKVGVGTANSLQSKVWFTLGHDGTLTEVYYPTVEVANVQTLQFIIVSADGKRVELESDLNIEHQLTPRDPQALIFTQTNQPPNKAWTLRKTYITDPERSTVLINVAFQERTAAPHQLYVYYDPSLNNSGMHDSAWTQNGALLAQDKEITSALVIGGGAVSDSRRIAFDAFTNGFLGTSDGLTQLRRFGKIKDSYRRATDGNVVQVARVMRPPLVSGKQQNFTLALGFGQAPHEALQNARASLRKGFVKTREAYVAGWHRWVKTLRRVAAKYQRQFDMAAMVLKAHEDKTFRGATVASLSIPWGGAANANEPGVGGYHLVWARDLYQAATALDAMGDKAAAGRALDYLFNVQQKADGSFPQNSWLDGRSFGNSLQMDEVALPIILAAQLGRTDRQTWERHIKPAANFIIAKGAYTPQERWEEKAGYSPSTIAAESAALICAADVARRNGDEEAAAKYTNVADEWARRVERWTATENGIYGDGHYYVRISEKGDPNAGAKIAVNSTGAVYLENQIVDAGFLELVRLGVKRADDPLIVKSLLVVDQLLKVETPHGACWYRYNHDSYGEMDNGRKWNFDGRYTGKGRLWVLLTGERGEYELARGRRDLAQMRLAAMCAFANDGLMLPEQIWDMAQTPVGTHFKFGAGTDSATPLVWSLAQFIRLAANLQAGRNLDTPPIAVEHFITQAALPK